VAQNRSNRHKSALKLTPRATLGRPPRDEIDTLKTQAWFYSVAVASQKSLRALDREFNSGSSGVWSRYRQGETSPSEARIAQVERAYSGTAAYYRSMIWDLGQPDLLGSLDYRRALLTLAPELRQEFVDESALGTQFWRKQGDPGRPLNRLVELVKAGQLGIEPATAIAALVHEAVWLQDKRRFAMCVEVWAIFCRLLERHPVLSFLDDEFFYDFGASIFDHVCDEPQLFRSASTAVELFG